MKIFLSIFIASIIFVGSSQALSQESISGLWALPQDGTLIEINIKSGLAEGFIVSRPENQKSELDEKNPDPELRGKPILGLKVLDNLSNDEKDRWIGGEAYDPNSGKTYRAQAQLKDQDTLFVRGYVGFPFLGRTTVLKRYRN